MKTDMGLMPARDGNNYGFEFVKRNGKAFLNVQLLQNSMDAPKIIGSFPCKKVARREPERCSSENNKMCSKTGFLSSDYTALTF
jgi:hypothetical protein